MNVTQFLAAAVGPSAVVAQGPGWAVLRFRPDLKEELGWHRHQGLPVPEDTRCYASLERWRSRGTRPRPIVGAGSGFGGLVLIRCHGVAEPVIPARDGYPGTMCWEEGEMLSVR